MAAPRMTKTQLQTALAEETGTDRKSAAAFLTALVDIAYSETKKKGEFVLPGIGKLVKQKRAARIGVNPKTGEKLKIAAKTVVKLRVAKAAKDAVLGGDAAGGKAAAGKPGAKAAAKPAAKATPSKAPAAAKQPAKKAPAAPAKASAKPAAKAPAGKSGRR